MVWLALLLWALVFACSDGGVTLVRAQGMAGRTAPRVKLLCDLAKAVEWPKEGDVLAVVMVQFSEEDAHAIRQTLGQVPQAPWRESWVTNYAFTPTGKHLGSLPACGILAISGQVVSGSLASRVLANVPSRAFLTVGEGFQNFSGMVNLSADGALTVNRRKMQAAGLQFPSALMEEYKNSGVRVNIIER